MTLPAAIQIVNPGVHETEDGPPAAVDATFIPGETVYYSFQVTGYGAAPMKKVRLSYHIDAFDPKGVRIVEPIDSILDATLSEEDKDWKPKIRAAISIPPSAPGGSYKIAATVTDDISHATASAETTFRAAGHTIEPASELTVRNFGFFRSDAETEAIKTPVFRPGDHLIARFDITGYRLGPNNTVNVFYDVAVLNGEGKQIFGQQHAAEEKSFSFYPKPFVPGSMNLSLQSTMRSGEYAVVVTVHDEIGHQQYEAKQGFQIE